MTTEVKITRGRGAAEQTRCKHLAGNEPPIGGMHDELLNIALFFRTHQWAATNFTVYRVAIGFLY